jgi:N4-gp56 family major capsid protein
MANAYTSTATVGGTKGGAGLLQHAYDKVIEFELRSEPVFRTMADKKPTNLTNPGDVISLQRWADMAIDTGTLQETVDPDAVAIGTPTVQTMTLQERGKAAIGTVKLDKTAYVKPETAELLSRNMRDTLDKVYSNVLIAGTNVLYSGNATSVASTDNTDIITSTLARKITAKLRGASVSTRKAGYFWGGIHPDVSADLRSETGAAAWRDPHVYSAADKIWAGEIGAYEGSFYIETPRMHVDYQGASTGAGSFTNTGGSAGSSGAYTITLTAETTSGTIEAGYLVTGTNVGASARVVSVSDDGLTVTVSVANGGAVSGTITFQPTHKVYKTLYAGKQALAEAVAIEPHAVIGNMTDSFNRFQPIGWYGLLAQARYREEALWRIESGSAFA